MRTMQWDLAGSSLGDSLKELGSSLETRREITRKMTGGLTIRLSKVTRNPGGGQQLSVSKPPIWRVNCPYHRIWAMANQLLTKSHTLEGHKMVEIQVRAVEEEPLPGWAETNEVRWSASSLSILALER
ncbi:hypothetical protein B296_00029539 [Ensete ventricosum]|uniref:Uncharacterized protein n=1 Tax=Ensete ventricosum TaxID=4639 RepID=A0A426YX91_ENSVE|nr:hypothetical protein B296_00029539 [Ensete ventricosum]